MADRISTFQTTSKSLSQTLSLQAKYADKQVQSASGLRSETYTGIAGDSNKLLNLQSQFDVVNNQILVINSAKGRMGAMDAALGGIVEVVSTISSQLMTATTDSNGISAVTAEQANAWMTEIASYLNRQYAGDYMFGGSVQNVAPVDLSDVLYTPTAAPTTPDTDYYQGDNAAITVRASTSLKVDYGITADSDGFEKIFRALSLIAANPSDQATLLSSYDLVRDALSDIADERSALGSKTALLEQEYNSQVAALDYLKGSVSDLRDVDIAATAVELASIETQLQASYSTLSTILSLKLTDYLR